MSQEVGASCPDEAVIAAFTQGQLDPSRADEVEAHLDDCEACSQVVAELVRIFDEEPDEAPSLEPPAMGLRSEELAVTLGAGDEAPMPRPIGTMLAPGSEVGRYRVLECVGVGGMGVVYAAYDPQLDRRVALKLLRGTVGDPEHEARSGRLLREAQALARLTHPNVITVHDTGTWKQQVFVAMEFVQGPTLAKWLAQPRRTWPEIRDVFVAAGRGLAAAHEAGMVHRDFKPDNVLIGEDGRVRVTDFGLARWGPSTRPSAEMVATDELSLQELLRASQERISLVKSPVVSLTETGSLVGTPAYMAPEQYEQRPADAASDQFAFCVALFEAIYGERPFAGQTVAELASNVLDGRMIDTAGELQVPRAVRQALRRGLSRRPSDRFASMNELLAVLDHRPSRRYRVAALVGVPAAALGVGLWAWATAAPARSEFCREDAGLASSFTAARREAVRAAFVATELPYAEDTAQRVLEAAHEHVRTWESLREQACRPEAAAQDGPGVTALRERCLVRDRLAFETLIEVFEQADRETVGRAVGAVTGLSELERCGDAEQLLAALPPPVPAEQREQVEALRDELSRGEGLVAAGRYADGLSLARQLDARAQALGHRSVMAETRLLLGQMLDLTGDPEAAYEAFEDAAIHGAASRHRRVTARALMHQVYVLGVALPRMDEAERVARRAEAEMEGAQLGEGSMAALLLNRSSVAFRRGDFETALALGRRSLELRDRDKDPLRWADTAFNLATIESTMGNVDSAIERLEDYLVVFERELGHLHPEVSAGYQNLGVSYFNAGRNEEARAALQKAEEIRRLTLGVDHPAYAGTLNMLSSLALADGRPEDALRHSEQSIAILEANQVPPSEIASNRAELAEALLALGRVEQAGQQAERALADYRTDYDDDHPALAAIHHLLARVAGERGDVDTVRREMDRALAVRSAALGEDNDEVEQVRVDRATLLGELGLRDEAVATLRSRLAAPQGDPPRSPHLYARVALADLLWSEPERRAEAIELMRTAKAGFERLGMTSMTAQTQTWLDEHRP